MFETIFVILLVAFAACAIWAFFVSRKIKKEGIETDATVSRVGSHEWSGGAGDIGTQDTVTEEYYITYVDQEGRAVEALLSNPGDHTFKEGDKVKIKYLPDKPEYPVLLED